MKESLRRLADRDPRLSGWLEAALHRSPYPIATDREST
jgi:hypothetical protein